MGETFRERRLDESPIATGRDHLHESDPERTLSGAGATAEDQPVVLAPNDLGAEGQDEARPGRDGVDEDAMADDLPAQGTVAGMLDDFDQRQNERVMDSQTQGEHG